MIKADGKSKIFKKGYKKFFAEVNRGQLIVRKGPDAKELKTVNIASSLVAFQKDKKGEYIRIANADDVFEFKPESSKAKIMNDWKESLQATPNPPSRGGMRSSMFLPQDPARPKSQLLLTSASLVGKPSMNGKPKSKPLKFTEVSIAKDENEPIGLRCVYSRSVLWIVCIFFVTPLNHI